MTSQKINELLLCEIIAFAICSSDNEALGVSLRKFFGLLVAAKFIKSIFYKDVKLVFIYLFILYFVKTIEKFGEHYLLLILIYLSQADLDFLIMIDFFMPVK